MTAAEIAAFTYERLGRSRLPSGMESGQPAPRCINSEPGTYGHECGKPARWLGEEIDSGQPFKACYCSKCKESGTEARRGKKTWTRLG
jgi:hypothetical protein